MTKKHGPVVVNSSGQTVVNVPNWSLEGAQANSDDTPKLPEGPTFTATGTCGDTPQMPPPAERNMAIRFRSIKAFGLEWWAEQTTFKALVTLDTWEEADVKPLTKATVECAEWWRRAGFHLIARPYDWVANRTARPFARWILDIEPDEDDL